MTPPPAGGVREKTCGALEASSGVNVTRTSVAPAGLVTETSIVPGAVPDAVNVHTDVVWAPAPGASTGNAKSAPSTPARAAAQMLRTGFRTDRLLVPATLRATLGGSIVGTA